MIDSLTAKWNEWYPFGKFTLPWEMAMEGKVDEVMSDSSIFKCDPYPEINGYTPIAAR